MCLCNCGTNLSGPQNRYLKETCLDIAQKAIGANQADNGEHLIKMATNIYEFLKAEDNNNSKGE